MEVKETEEGQLVILNAEDEEIARHRVVVGHNQHIAVADHCEGIRSSSRQTAKRSD